MSFWAFFPTGDFKARLLPLGRLLPWVLSRSKKTSSETLFSFKHLLKTHMQRFSALWAAANTGLSTFDCKFYAVFYETSPNTLQVTRRAPTRHKPNLIARNRIFFMVFIQTRWNWCHLPQCKKHIQFPTPTIQNHQNLKIKRARANTRGKPGLEALANS